MKYSLGLVMSSSPASSATHSLRSIQLRSVNLKNPGIYSRLLFEAVRQDFLELNSFSQVCRNTDVYLRLDAAYAPNSEAIT